MPATDTTDFEREFSELVAELRALPSAAPAPLRDRVRALGEPTQPDGFWDRMHSFAWRRAVLVLAPVCVLGVLGAAVVHGLANSGPPQPAVVANGSARVPNSESAGDLGLAPPLLGPNANRYQDYEAWMRVRVKDFDALSDQTNEASRIARSLGGYVASVEESSNGGSGQSDLVLRVPVAHVEQALVRLTQLGTVVERHMSIRDLEQVVAQQRARMLKLKVFIARATETLAGDLPADVRLRLQLQLAEAKRNLARTTAANKATCRGSRSRL
jgi:uncharacterized protein DUF4349